MNIVPIRKKHLINANPSAELSEPWIAVTEPLFFLLEVINQPSNDLSSF